MHDHCAGVLPLTAASPAFRDLLLEQHGLECQPDPALKLLAHIVGCPDPRGGAGRLTDALVSHLRSLGGDLHCVLGARSIEVRAGKGSAACGSRTGGARCRRRRHDAQRATARRDAARRRLPTRPMNRLRGWRYGVGTFKVDFALDAPVPWSWTSRRSSGRPPSSPATGRRCAGLYVAGASTHPGRESTASRARGGRRAARGPLAASLLALVGQGRHARERPRLCSRTRSVRKGEEIRGVNARVTSTGPRSAQVPVVRALRWSRLPVSSRSARGRRARRKRRARRRFRSRTPSPCGR